MPRKGQRASHCKNGHARLPENVDRKGYCRQCSRVYYKQWREHHKEEGRAAARKWRYGLTQSAFDWMMTLHNRRCAICSVTLDSSNKVTKPHVDHDHTTGAIRGILCGACNAGLGHFADKVDVLYNAITYLSRTKEDYGTSHI